MARYLDAGDDLGLPWDEWADGKLWRLEQGKDFTRGPSVVEEAAKNAAARMGKAVRTVKDTKGGRPGVWVQFADHAVQLGSPCPCGSTELKRVNENYAICEACGSTLMFFQPKTKSKPPSAAAVKPSVDERALRAQKRDEEREQRRKEVEQAREARREENRRAAQSAKARAGAKAGRDPLASLDSYEDVRLFPLSRAAKREQLYGYGRRSGKRVLLVVSFPLRDGKRIDDPDSPGGHVHSVRSVPVKPFGDAIDFEALERLGDGVDVRAPVESQRRKPKKKKTKEQEQES